MFRDTRYYEYYLPVEPGQTLVLYTDGATEASKPDGCEFGRDRLEQKVREGKDLSAKELIKSLHDAILEWTDGRGSSDDVTFVIIKAL